MSHISDLEDTEVNAGFMFVRTQPSLLTREVIRKITLACFKQLNVPACGIYSKYIVLAEDNGNASDSGKLFSWEHGMLLGTTLRIPVSAVRQVDDKRREHERNRKPGQESTRPKRQFLTSSTLVIVIGGGRFLGENLRFYLEDEGLVRDHVIDTLLTFLSMPTWKESSKKNQFAFLKPAEIPGYKFYEGYFNALLDDIIPDENREMSTQELVKKLQV